MMLVLNLNLSNCKRENRLRQQYPKGWRANTALKPEKDWQYLQIIKKREGSKLVRVTTKVIYGDPEEVKALLGEHTAYIERTNLTSRQMNGRLVRKTLSFSKELRPSC